MKAASPWVSVRDVQRWKGNVAMWEYGRDGTLVFFAGIIPVSGAMLTTLTLVVTQNSATMGLHTTGLVRPVGVGEVIFCRPSFILEVIFYNQSLQNQQKDHILHQENSPPQPHLHLQQVVCEKIS